MAFFASLTTRPVHLGANQDIAFDNAVTNIGNAYNPHHGVFIAPVAGVYVFTVTLRRDGDRTYAHVMKNNQILAKLDFPLHGDQVSQTVILDLNKGDDVAVQNTSTDRTFTADRYSTFSGFLLYGNTQGPQVVGR